MGNITARIRKRLNMTLKAWKSDKQFSRRYAMLRVMDELGGRLGFKKLSNWAHSQKDQFILGYLQFELRPVIEKFRNDDTVGEPQENVPIWVCWWTGEETAPPLVKQCIRSIRARAGAHPVHLISEANFAEYLNIPAFILEKMRSGQMGLAQFSDYLRVSLLYEYGGLWLDATIFCSQSVPEWFFSLPVFSCKSEYRESRYISSFQWTAFCLGGHKGNVFFHFVKEAFEAFWKNASAAIDYLFIDYLIFLAKDEISAVRQFFEQIPVNTPHRDDLQAAMNAALPAEKFWDVIQENTPLYKLSWRETYAETTADGKESVYGYFLNLSFEKEEEA